VNICWLVPVVFPFRIGRVFHVKSSCLLRLILLFFIVYSPSLLTKITAGALAVPCTETRSRWNLSHPPGRCRSPLQSAPNLRWTSVSATIYQQVHSVTTERKKHNILVSWLVFAYVSCSSTIVQRCRSLVGFATEEHPYVPKNFPEYADTFRIWNLYV